MLSGLDRKVAELTALQDGAFRGPTHDFKPKFDSLLHMGELYSYHHLNFPSAAKDQQIPASTKERMMNAATQSSVYPLVATGATRYFLMTKLILQWIINQLFTRSLFAGLDEEADRRIDQLRAAIFLDTPITVRHDLLCQISSEIQQLRQHPNFHTFLDTLISTQSTQLWAILRPLMHKTTPKDWEDLKTLMKQAYLVAGDMASLPYEWRFDFPRCGIPYQTTMINRDPYIHDLTDQQIANRRLPVRLGFIPAVYWRDNSNGQIKTGQLIRPQVLIVHPNKTPTKTPNHTPNHIPFHTPNQTITPTHGRSI